MQVELLALFSVAELSQVFSSGIPEQQAGPDGCSHCPWQWEHAGIAGQGADLFGVSDPGPEDNFPKGILSVIPSCS